MLLDPHSRFFVRHELRFRAQRDQGPALPFRDARHLDVEDALKAAMDADKASLVLRNQDVVRLTALQVRPRDHMAVLLFRRADPAAAAPVFENQRTRKLRKSDKRDDESVTVSAHLFVHLQEKEGVTHPTYDAILEEVPGLSRTYIQVLIGDILREVKYTWTDHRKRPRETYSIVELNGVKSDSIGQAMNNSAVPYVTLVRPGSVAGLDSEHVQPRDETMKLFITAEPSETVAVLRKIKAWALGSQRGHGKWKDVRVQIDMPERRSRIVSIARDIDAADILFLRSEPVNVPTPMLAATEVINEELVAKAKEMFAAGMAEA